VFSPAGFSVPVGPVGGFGSGIIGSPVVLNGGGSTITLSDVGGTFVGFTNGLNDFDYAVGTPLLLTDDGTGVDPQGPLTISFSPGVRAFGFYAQDFAFDDETFNFVVTDSVSGNTPFSLGPFDNTGIPGTSVFIGAEAAPGDDITQVVLSSISTDGSPPDDSNDFAIGDGLVAAPEPGSAALFALGAVAVVAIPFRRRFRHVSVAPM
jgi:hypothetical protein